MLLPRPCHINAIVRLIGVCLASFSGCYMTKEIDRRLDRMIEIADEIDVPLDHVVLHMGRCDQRTFDALSDNPSLLPRYTKSSVKP